MKRAALATPLILIVLLAVAPPVHASAQPAAAPSFLSSAVPVTFVGENFTYVPQASEPANWSAGTSGLPYSVLTASPLSQYADLRGSLPAGSHSFSLRINASGSSAWQNWTTTSYSLPFIYSVPYFTPNAGEFYNYTPTYAGSGTFSFSGAPYLSVNSATGDVSGTVAAGTYTNLLTLNSSAGNFTQAWVTSTSGMPATVNFLCWVGHHRVNATIDLTRGYAEGCGNAGIFSGEYTLMVPTVLTATAPFIFNATTFGNIYTAYLATNVTTSAITVYFYGAPGSAVSETVNYAAIGSPTMPSGGFETASYSPPYKSTPSVGPGGGGGGGCTTNCSGTSAPPAPAGGLGGGFAWPPLHVTILTVVGVVIAMLGLFLTVVLRGRERAGGLLVVVVGVVVALV